MRSTLDMLSQTPSAPTHEPTILTSSKYQKSTDPKNIKKSSSQKKKNPNQAEKTTSRKKHQKNRNPNLDIIFDTRYLAHLHRLLNFVDRGTCLCAIKGTSTTVLLNWICGTSTTFCIGLCYSVSRPGLSLDEDTDSEKPPTSSELTAWLVLGVAT